MPYVDKAYYNDEYMGKLFDNPEEFDKYAKRASERINELTHYRIRDINSFHEFQQEQIKKAVCAQIEFYLVKGGYVEIDSGEDYSNFAIGSFSYSKGGASSNKQADRISPAVLTYLKPTGLLYTGVRSYG